MANESELLASERTVRDAINRASYTAYFAGLATLILQNIAMPVGAPLDARFWLLNADSVATILLGWLVGRGSSVAGIVLIVQCAFTGWRYWQANHPVYAFVTLAVFGGIYLLGFKSVVDLARIRSALAKFRDAVV